MPGTAGSPKRGEHQRLATVLFTTLEAAWRATWLLEPIIPRAAARLRNDLGAREAAATPGDVGELRWNRFAPGATVNLGTPRFPKLRPTAGA
jgi:methionyl-tRNA synthetase